MAPQSTPPELAARWLLDRLAHPAGKMPHPTTLAAIELRDELASTHRELPELLRRALSRYISVATELGRRADLASNVVARRRVYGPGEEDRIGRQWEELGSDCECYTYAMQLAGGTLVRTTTLLCDDSSSTSIVFLAGETLESLRAVPAAVAHTPNALAAAATDVELELESRRYSARLDKGDAKDGAS